MRKNLGAQTCLYPMPVLVIGTYDNLGIADAMIATWGGILDVNQISMCLTAGHKTVNNILERRAFTVSIADASHVKECDYVGLVSANEVSDKLSQAGFHTTKSEFVDAPIIDELLVTFECEMISYNEATGFLTGEIKNVSVDENILSKDDKIDPEKLRPISFDSMNCTYHVLGPKVGNALSDGLALKR